MSQTIEDKNKALVLKAFDTLFNKRDYAAAERFWSPTTFSTASTSRPDAKACSISSRHPADTEV
jgi:hypothetical protein